MNPNGTTSHPLDEALAGNGLRMTRQRRLVYEALVSSQGEHPTADELFHQVKQRMPGISLATVYNCLEKLVDCGLIRQVHRDRESTRYCGNLKPHGHFHCNRCGKVEDVDLAEKDLLKLGPKSGAGFQVQQFEINFRGLCPECHNRN